MVRILGMRGVEVVLFCHSCSDEHVFSRGHDITAQGEMVGVESHVVRRSSGAVGHGGG